VGCRFLLLSFHKVNNINKVVLELPKVSLKQGQGKRMRSFIGNKEA
jgi:hypothetical protein